MSGSHEKRNLIIAGLIIGAIAGFLVLAGNPGNMGFCIACFVRDTVGGLGPVSYTHLDVYKRQLWHIPMSLYCSLCEL